MTKEEFNEITRDNEVSSVPSSTDDPMFDLLKEIYYAGHVEGYLTTIMLLQAFGTDPSKCNFKGFFDQNTDKLRRRIAAIYEYTADEH